jgi:uncharacterized LabA/DUF88 family protein
MHPYAHLPADVGEENVMVFIDGENLAIRYEHLLAQKIPSLIPPSHVRFKKGVFVWSALLSSFTHRTCTFLRRYYYTTVQGNTSTITSVEEKLKSLGIEAPRVFKKDRGKRSKRVDISLATDMLTHGHRGNYDIAVLVAGDEDYVPLVEAVMREGRRVVLWSIEDGLSPILKRSVDYNFDIGDLLLNDEEYVRGRHQLNPFT